ncbi:hypothetical protein GGS21DRAFT_490522 [Xylaria nigripes]|nr:hypothetical protein GGS21DRAFT_490522 [Xylaria nigripes]
MQRTSHHGSGHLSHGHKDGKHKKDKNEKKTGKESKKEKEEKPRTDPSKMNLQTVWYGLPPRCRYEELFGSMRRVGAVSYAHIEDTYPGQRSTCAIVEFFERESVVRLMAQTITIGDYLPTILLGDPVQHTPDSRENYAEYNETPVSRALKVTGHQSIISWRQIAAAFDQSYFEYEVSDYEEEHGTFPYCTVRIRFSKYYTQANYARSLIFDECNDYRFLSEEQRNLWAQVRCVYDYDPCE